MSNEKIYSATSGADVCFENYIKKRGKVLHTFFYESQKRHKLKTISFIKNNHDINDIKIFLEKLGLEIIINEGSKHKNIYKIIDIKN